MTFHENNKKCAKSWFNNTFRSIGRTLHLNDYDGENIVESGGGGYPLNSTEFYPIRYFTLYSIKRIVYRQCTSLLTLYKYLHVVQILKWTKTSIKTLYICIKFILPSISQETFYRWRCWLVIYMDFICSSSVCRRLNVCRVVHMVHSSTYSTQ